MPALISRLCACTRTDSQVPTSPTGHDCNLERVVPEFSKTEVPAKSTPSVYKEGYEPTVPTSSRDSFGNPLSQPDPYAVSADADSRPTLDQTPPPPIPAPHFAKSPLPLTESFSTPKTSVNASDDLVKPFQQANKNVMVSLQAWAGIPGPDSMHSDSSPSDMDSPARELVAPTSQVQSYVRYPLQAPVSKAMGAVSYTAGTATGVAAALTVMSLLSVHTVLHTLSTMVSSRLLSDNAHAAAVAEDSRGTTPAAVSDPAEMSWLQAVQGAASVTYNEAVALTQNTARLTVQTGYWAAGAVAGVISKVRSSPSPSPEATATRL